MEYDVSHLAAQTDVTVDTIRYYQTIGVLHAPRRDGRKAVYDDSHVRRLERIRSMAARGYSLKSIRELVDERLLEAIVDERESAAGDPATALSSREFAEKVGIPLSVLKALEKAGVGGLGARGNERPYSAQDLEMASSAKKLLDSGVPISRLLTLAISHDRSMKKTVDRSIDLFDDFIRKREGDTDLAPDELAEAFRELLPVVLKLVGYHFERLLVGRALERLEKSGVRIENP